MITCRFTLLLAVCWGISSNAQEVKLMSGLSPKLRIFLMEHPPARTVLTNAIVETYSKKTVSLYYFYSDDVSVPRAGHFYPNTVAMPNVVIYIRENQSPADEYVCVLFEVINSQAEKRFLQLVQDAKDGTVTKSQFAREILKAEFDAAKRVRDIVRLPRFDGQRIG